MECRDAVESLEMYIAGDLPDSESLNVAVHLAECDACSQRHESMRSLVGELRGLADAFVPAERFVTRSPAPRGSGSRGWRLATAAAVLVALLSTGALAVPALARQLPLPLSAELGELEDENEALQEQVDELNVRLESIDGQDVPVVDTTPGDLPPDVNAAVQNLAMGFVRAQYEGDLEAMKAMSTDSLKLEIERDPEVYLRTQGAAVVFAQMTEAAAGSEEGTYVVFVRLQDSAEWSDSQYQEDFEIRRVGEAYLVDFCGMDA